MRETDTRMAEELEPGEAGRSASLCSKYHDSQRISYGVGEREGNVRGGDEQIDTSSYAGSNLDECIEHIH